MNKQNQFKLDVLALRARWRKQDAKAQASNHKEYLALASRKLYDLYATYPDVDLLFQRLSKLEQTSHVTSEFLLPFFIGALSGLLSTALWTVSDRIMNTGSTHNSILVQVINFCSVILFSLIIVGTLLWYAYSIYKTSRLKGTDDFLLELEVNILRQLLLPSSDLL